MISIVYTTFPDDREAKTVILGLLNEKLIACANVFPPIKSFYAWEGKMAEQEEVAVILKTQKHLVPSLYEHLKEKHSYDCPCFVELSGEGLGGPFEKWIQQMTQTQES